MYVFKPSLKHMTLIKIVATLYNQDDVKNLLARFHNPSYTDFKSKWLKIEALVVKKLAELPLPKPMKEKISSFISPVGLQIANWKQFHDRGCNLRVNLPHEFSWTPQGTIDRKKTAEVMIKDESRKITTRYMLACIYCLEDDIKKLWDKIPKQSRKSFYSQEGPNHVKQNELVVFWTYHIKGEMDKITENMIEESMDQQYSYHYREITSGFGSSLATRNSLYRIKRVIDDSMVEERMDRRCSLYQYAFEISANSGNIVATKYFLQKLTPGEREVSLVKTAKSVLFPHFDGNAIFIRETYSHVLFFLLHELNEEQQIEVLKCCGYQVLICFLNWPLQIYFMETASCMWSFFSKNTYSKVLICIIDKIKEGCKDFDYRKLFGEFWEQSPNDYKENVCVGFDCRIVSDLFMIRDENNIRLIFKDATPEEKKHLIYNYNAKAICKDLMNDNQLSLLKYFIEACLPSKDEIIEFKEKFENGYVWHVTKHLMSSWQQKFLCLLDDVVCDYKKRKCEEDDSSKTKVVCNAELKDVPLMAEK